MTSISTTRPSHARERAENATLRKAHLFCECGRTAPHDEWGVRPGPDGNALVCPDCRAVLTVR